jgi:hypothetical protein
MRYISNVSPFAALVRVPETVRALKDVLESQVFAVPVVARFVLPAKVMAAADGVTGAAKAGTVETSPKPNPATATSAILRLRVFNIVFLSNKVASRDFLEAAGVEKAVS